MRFRNLAALLFVFTLGIIFFALFWLLNTNNGARWMLSQVPHLTAKQIHGTISGGLKISELNWSSGSMRLTAQNLQWVMRPSHLLWGELDITDLEISHGQLYLPKPSSKPSSLNLEWPALPLWTRFVEVRFGPAAIEKLHVWQGQKTALKLTSATLKNLSWNHGNIHIDELMAKLPNGKLKLSAQIQVEKRGLDSKGDWIEPSPANTSLHWSTAWHGMGNNAFGGPINLIFNQNNSISNISSHVQIAQHQISLKSMILKNPSLSKSATGAWKIDLPEDSAGDFTVNGKLENIVARDMPKSLPTGPLSLKIHLHGNIHQYLGTFAVHGLPKFGGFAGNIKGSDTGLQYDYTGDVLGAKLLPAKLKINWRPKMTFQGELRFRGLQNQRFFPTIPGQLSCNLDINATQLAKGMNGYIQLQMLPSQIYKTNLEGEANLSFSGNHWNLQKADFRGPGVTLSAAGNLKNHLSFSLKVANWKGLIPGAGGSTNAHGWIAQTNQNWVGSIQAHGQRLLYAGIAIHKVDAQASLLNHNNLQANLHIDGAEYKTHLINLQSQVHGTLAQMEVDFIAQSDSNQFTLHSFIKHSHSAWTILLNQSHLQSKILGDWQLENASTLSWSTGAIRISPLVFNNTHGSKISVQGLYNPAANLADINLNVLSLPLDFHKHVDEMSLEGYLNAHVQAQCHGICHAEGNWNFEKTKLHWLSDDVHQSADLQQFSGKMRWEPKDLTLTSKLDLPKNWGSAQIQLHSPVTLALPWRWNRQAALQATIQAKLGAPLFAALPIGTLKMRAQGIGNIEADLSGTWSDPKWHGTAELHGLGLYVPQAGLDLQDVGAKLLGNGQELQISDMHATSGTGRISGNGTIHLLPETHLSLQIKGHEFTALNLPQVQAAVSPDLHIDGSLKKINIGGVIHTNRLRILGTDFNGPKPSSDVVFVKNIKKEHSGPALSVNLQVTLGNDAKVLISGLRAHLVGALNVMMHDGHSPTVKGILRMVDGHYDIYGHSLDFERGSINFHGDANQANLDVLAVRTIKNSDSFAVDNTPVKAGVQVTGTLQVPQVNLYSNPSMSQADILSYLVLGTPSSSLGNQDELLSAAAGTLFSASRAALFGNSLSSTGIDVGVTSNGQQGLSGAMVTLGHYLTPDLYLSVGQSVMGNGTVARLRYRVSKHIELQTENGTQNGANIFYRIDF